MNNRKGRPCLRRHVDFNTKIKYFKPQGVGMSELEIIELLEEEIEAIRLKNVRDLDQKECSEIMKTSPATFQRILSRANKKIALALTEGKAIKIISS